MSETFHMFLKANIKNHGYIYKWSDVSNPSVDEETLDKALPIIDSSSDGHGIAYAVTQLSPSWSLMVVGGYWKGQTDEHKRAGLSYWHGVLVDLQQINRETLWNLSNVLLGMLQRFDIGYHEIGELVGTLAKKRQESSWASSLFQLMHNIKPSMTNFEKKIVLAFMENNKLANSKINLHIDFPLHPFLAAPCMLSMVLFEPKLRRIGGGNLLVSKPSDFQIISVKNEIRNYQKIAVNNLFGALLDANNQTAQQIDDGESFSFRQIIVSAIFILVIVTLCIAGYFAFIDTSWFRR